MSLNRIWMPINAYTPGGSSRRLVVVHITAGALSNPSLYNFIKNPANGASYQVSFDGAVANTCYEYMRVPQSSWSCCNFNGVSVNGCLCAPAAAVNWTRQQWLDNSVMFNNAAAWVGEECKRLGIPLVGLTPSQAQGGSRGVCQHKDLGSSGCGHSDCGVSFPMDELLRRAAGQQPAPQPPPETGEVDMALMTPGVNKGTPVPIIPGNTRLRLFSQGPANVEITWRPSNKNFPVARPELTDANAVDVPIPGGATAAWLVRRDEGSADVGYAVGK